MAKIEFTAFPRTGGEGRGASRRLRRGGKAPGIVYGGTVEPTTIELDHNALMHALKNEAFHASILTMKLDGGAHQVLLRDVQMHPYRPQVLHVDFQRVDANKKIHMKVPLHFVNGDQSPAVKVGGAIVSHVLNEIDVSCLPGDLPEFIEVDLSGLETNKAFKASDLKLPAGVVTLTHGKDPVVATAVIPKAIVETEEETAAAAEAAAAVPGAPVAAAPGAEGAKPEDAKAGDKKDEKAAKADKDDKKKK
ncbi:MAG TPA: 50S ribosomal protein L25/general stress protein Ctc [Casimicrobiaceae bacterium]|nr:50S ribosomal protein L25/general stress protein Ctc [Casimicrobiaceae bacterium]